MERCGVQHEVLNLFVHVGLHVYLRLRSPPHYALAPDPLAASFKIPAFVVAPHRLLCLLSNIGAKHRGGVERHCWCSRRRESRRLVSEPLEAQCAATGGRS